MIEIDIIPLLWFWGTFVAFCVASVAGMFIWEAVDYIIRRKG